MKAAAIQALTVTFTTADFPPRQYTSADEDRPHNVPARAADGYAGGETRGVWRRASAIQRLIVGLVTATST